MDWPPKDQHFAFLSENVFPPQEIEFSGNGQRVMLKQYHQ
jgi:hypothetical protein